MVPKDEIFSLHLITADGLDAYYADVYRSAVGPEVRLPLVVSTKQFCEASYVSTFQVRYRIYRFDRVVGRTAFYKEVLE